MRCCFRPSIIVTVKVIVQFFFIFCNISFTAEVTYFKLRQVVKLLTESIQGGRGITIKEFYGVLPLFNFEFSLKIKQQQVFVANLDGLCSFLPLVSFQLYEGCSPGKR